MEIHHPLADGLVLRTAGPADLDQIAALLTDRGDQVDAVDHRLIVSDPEVGWEACAVVVDGDRVVSTASLLDEVLWLAGQPIPAGQVELVATARDYEGRGLVRALMGWAHECSAARGHLAQIMIGIPYFYRQFGYSYAIPLATGRPLTAAPPAAPGHQVHEATAAEIPAMAALQEAAQAGAQLRMPHSPSSWRWLVAHDATQQWLVTRDGAPVATGRTGVGSAGVRLAELAATDSASAYALVAHAASLAREPADPPPVRVYERPGTVGDAALAGYLGPVADQPQRYYARVPDPAALLAQLRPVLSARLAGSEFAEASGELVLSFYRSHLRLPYQAGTVGAPILGGTMQWVGSDGAAVPPDLLPSLLFGTDGFAGLARIHPDVSAGAHAAGLMAVLFPPVHGDLLSYYLP
ncbi:GNAT family N-acetyltransferase [Natronosporangium hydrolyticum]|uniref:GNAT family N-acetyltransferase n=1 Tax=Natronosporangium hydrolyticum TaxID=2811111 RepID=A0A895YC53_9ACTN|nr:GNAT family N-acetyltransferase [Natronosporangium hydrolyticum]QSB15041.1 GNAT family N-acetyltransferase [Natronosporangium hydrolyticum]